MDFFNGNPKNDKAAYLTLEQLRSIVTKVAETRELPKDHWAKTMSIEAVTEMR